MITLDFMEEWGQLEKLVYEIFEQSLFTWSNQDTNSYSKKCVTHIPIHPQIRILNRIPIVYITCILNIYSHFVYWFPQRSQHFKDILNLSRSHICIKLSQKGPVWNYQLYAQHKLLISNPHCISGEVKVFI